MATHTVMPKKLAQALMESSMQHFDVGGTAQPAAATSTFGGAPGATGSTTNTSLFGSITPQNSYSAQAPNITTQNLSGVIDQAQQEQQQTYGQQQSLAQTLLNQASGYGPNAAQNQLNQSTATNVANQAALAAGQRGSSSNVGLMARQIGQQGAATQQTAAGQGATLAAQQQQAATGQAASVENNLANQTLQSQSINQGAQASQNSAITTGELGADQINAGVSQQNSNNAAATAGGLLGGVGSLLGLYTGGNVPVQHFDAGGMANYATPSNPNLSVNAGPGVNELSTVDKMLAQPAKPKADSNAVALNKQAQSLNGSQTLQSNGVGMQAMAQTPATSAATLYNPALGSSAASMAAMTPSVSPTPLVFAAGGNVPTDFRSGGPVPGQAVVPGKNDPRNDTVPAMLSPGEEVLPLSVTTAKDPEKAAVAFMKHLKDQKDEEKGPKGYGKVIAARKKKGA